MKLNDYQMLALRTAPERSDTINAGHDLLHAGLGFASESGEFLDVLKKQHAYNKPLDVVNLREEIGDLLWYAAIACRGLGITLEDAASINIAKLAKRYPDRFTSEEALNRDIDAERQVLEGGAPLEMPPTLTAMLSPAKKVPLRRIPLGTGGMVLEEKSNGWAVTQNGEVIAQTGDNGRILTLTEKGDEGPWLFAAQQTINSL